MNEIIELMPAVYIASVIIVGLASVINLYLKIKDGVMYSSRLYWTHLMEIFIPIANTFVALMIIIIIIDDGLFEIERFLRRLGR